MAVTLQSDDDFDLERIEVSHGMWALRAVCRKCGVEYFGNVSSGLVDWQRAHKERCSKRNREQVQRDAEG